jgi:hypothetical protein
VTSARSRRANPRGQRGAPGSRRRAARGTSRSSERRSTPRNSVAKMEAAQRGRRGGAAATNHHALCLHGVEKKHGRKKMSRYFAMLAHEDFTRELLTRTS